MTDALALAGFVILLFPAGFFLLSAPAFLLVKLDIPEVSQLLRGLFFAYFLMMSIAGGFGIMAFAAAGRFVTAICIALLTAFAIWVRPWFLGKMDAQLGARDAGDAGAVRRLRWLHWQGMIGNALFIAAFVGSIPYVTST